MLIVEKHHEFSIGTVRKFQINNTTYRVQTPLPAQARECSAAPSEIWNVTKSSKRGHKPESVATLLSAILWPVCLGSAKRAEQTRLNRSSHHHHHHHHQMQWRAVGHFWPFGLSSHSQLCSIISRHRLVKEQIIANPFRRDQFVLWNNSATETIPHHLGDSSTY